MLGALPFFHVFANTVVLNATTVMGGMIAATSLAVFFVPVFFVLVRRVFKGSERQRKLHAHEAENGNGAPAAASPSGTEPHP